MKNAGTIAILLLYLTVLLRPALPSIVFCSQQDYFAAELCMFRDEPRSCCKGSCQMRRIVHETNGQTSENPLLRIQSEELVILLPTSDALELPAIDVQNTSFQEVIWQLSKGCEWDIWHPPTMQA